MGMSLTERDRRYSAIRELMNEDNLDCLVISSRDTYSTRGNTRYITNHGNNFGEEIVLFPIKGDPSIVASTIRGPEIQRAGWVQNFIPVANVTERVERVKQELACLDRGNKIGIVGMTYISVPVYLVVEKQCPNRVVDADSIFDQLRTIKSPEEIEKMRVSSWIADKTFLAIKDMLRPGISNNEIYGEAKALIHRMGCEYSMEYMPSYPYGKPMESNDILSMEFTPAYEGYYSQLTVTIPVTEYPRAVEKARSIWKEAFAAGVNNLRPGKKVSEVYQAALAVIQERGGTHMAHRFGHSIGLDAIDSWEFVPSDNTELKTGMTFVFHPRVILEPRISFGGGYTFVITDSGVEKLNKVDFC